MGARFSGRGGRTNGTASAIPLPASFCISSPPGEQAAGRDVIPRKRSAASNGRDRVRTSSVRADSQPRSAESGS
jgi:hypothetical protein